MKVYSNATIFKVVKKDMKNAKVEEELTEPIMPALPAEVLLQIQHSSTKPQRNNQQLQQLTPALARMKQQEQMSNIQKRAFTQQLSVSDLVISQ